ncbi:hypothetical protein GJ496_006963 [Pomphorhynchus laevis]|nr:hypothetical protein GJ496_006963 [Pomphorhynchus laevis]
MYFITYDNYYVNRFAVNNNSDITGRTSSPQDGVLSASNIPENNEYVFLTSDVFYSNRYAAIAVHDCDVQDVYQSANDSLNDDNNIDRVNKSSKILKDNDDNIDAAKSKDFPIVNRKTIFDAQKDLPISKSIFDNKRESTVPVSANNKQQNSNEQLQKINGNDKKCKNFVCRCKCKRKQP